MWLRPPDRPGPKNGLPDLAIRDGKWKLLVDRDGSSAELFDIEADPRERAELHEVHPAEFDRLKRLHQTWSAQLLPYPADARSYDVRTGTADRY